MYQDPLNSRNLVHKDRNTFTAMQHITATLQHQDVSQFHSNVYITELPLSSTSVSQR